MAVTRIGSLENRFIGLSTDTKPTTCQIGATFLEYDMQRLFVSPDGGTTWTLKTPSDLLTVKKVINLKQAADSYDLFTATTQNVFIDFLTIVIPADLTAEENLTSISIQSTDDPPVEFISATAGALANLTEGKHLQYSGPAVVASTKKIQLTIAGGATADDCNCLVYVSYRPVVDGGYLAAA
ncbi:MAG: hypothetical protein M0Q12_09650 [Synergistaceae bacterium]|jgi:hypothetical protein|nr:hypothetical protein [Synergistaceae bacterium]